MRGVSIIVSALFLFSVPPAPATGGCAPSGAENDCFAGAIELTGKPTSANNTGTTAESGEPADCGLLTHTLWFKIEAIGGSGTLRIDTSADFGIVAALYAGSAIDALTMIDCEMSWWDEGVWSPSVFAPCSPGTIYHLQLGTNGFQQGEIGLQAFGCEFKPTLPTEPRLSTPVSGSGSISLSWVEPWWDGGTHVNVSHYNVYRAPSDCGGAFTLIGSPTARSFQDLGLHVGSSWCYRVTAVNPVGEGPAEPGRLAATWGVPRPPPQVFVAPEPGSSLVLSWFPSPDQGNGAPFTEHRIYRANSAQGPFVFVGTSGPTSESYHDPDLGSNRTYHYRVSAVNEIGEGEQSPTASGTTYATPGQPRDVTVTHVLGTNPLRFRVAWSPPAGAEPITEYRIFRGSHAQGSTIQIGTSHREVPFFIDENRLPFHDYYYEVQAANLNGPGPASARVCIVYPTGTVLARCP